MTPDITTTVDPATAFVSILDASTLLVPVPTGIDSSTNAVTAAAAQFPVLAPAPNALSTVLNPFDPHYIIQNGSKDALYLAAPQTHAQCNQNMAVQAQCQQAKLSDASKGAASLTNALNKAKAVHLNADITSGLQHRMNKSKPLHWTMAKSPVIL